jgi:SAM-dependent methyltransferase
MPDLDWNLSKWELEYDWPEAGEEWSEAWGGSEAQWFGALFPRLHRFFPARRILEIAPGFGRWSKFLIAGCDEFIGLDMAPKCIESCRVRFADAMHARFFTNDGSSLAAAEDRSIDLVFSFDSLVHAESDVIASYVSEILKKLAPDGVAFIHHSNLHAYGKALGIRHGRGLTVSADIVADQVTLSGGKILIQEVVNWGGEHLIDCLTLFARRDSCPSAQPVRLTNPLFMGESTLIKNFQSPYSKLIRAQPAEADASDSGRMIA